MADHPEAMLVVERGINDYSVIPLDLPSCILGKAASATVLLSNPYVSRRHALISRRRDHFEIEDLESKNGTLVNGKRLASGAQRLRTGDRIELGRGQVVFRFQSWGSTLTLPPAHQSTTADLVVDTRSREIWLRGQRVSPPFSRKEFDVLALLYQRRGEACSKDDIAAHGWPERAEGDVADQDIEQYIRRLRLRIEPDPSNPQHIITVRRFGYRLS